jgi:hypothetical protein
MYERTENQWVPNNAERHATDNVVLAGIACTSSLGKHVTRVIVMREKAVDHGPSRNQRNERACKIPSVY